MRILVDMDGIVVDFFTSLFNMYEQRTGETVNVDQILGWDMGDYVKDLASLMKCLDEPGVYSSMLPLPGAVEALYGLSKKHDIVVVSHAISGLAAKEKIEWCNNWLSFIGSDNIVLCKRKNLVQGDIIIDDALHNVWAYKKDHPGAIGIGIAYPYNHEYSFNDPYDLRAQNYMTPDKAWNDIEFYINLLCEYRYHNAI